MQHDVICMICGTVMHQVTLPDTATQTEILNATTNTSVHGDDVLHGNETQFCYVTLRENQEAERIAEELAFIEAERERLGIT